MELSLIYTPSLTKFLWKLIRKVGRAVKGLVNSGAGKAPGDTVKPGAKTFKDVGAKPKK